ncbi:hypothetical protein PFISCL1PPCAC_18977, partial [Pristionchus fissidentatus]
QDATSDVIAAMEAMELNLNCDMEPGDLKLKVPYFEDNKLLRQLEKLSKYEYGQMVFKSIQLDDDYRGDAFLFLEKFHAKVVVIESTTFFCQWEFDKIIHNKEEVRVIEEHSLSHGPIYLRLMKAIFNGSTTIKRFSSLDMETFAFCCLVELFAEDREFAPHYDEDTNSVHIARNGRTFSIETNYRGTRDVRCEWKDE